jgi:hypothetical protein
VSEVSAAVQLPTATSLPSYSPATRHFLFLANQIFSYANEMSRKKVDERRQTINLQLSTDATNFNCHAIKLIPFR